MPRPSRQIVAGHYYHVLNRGNGRMTLFHMTGKGVTTNYEIQKMSGLPHEWWARRVWLNRTGLKRFGAFVS